MPRGRPRKEEQEERTEGELQAENASLKQQLAAAVKKPSLEVKYETSNSEEAARYLDVGGRIVTCTALYPKNPKKAGKIFGFVETKEELEELAATAKEQGL